MPAVHSPPNVEPTRPEALAAFAELYREFVRPGELVFDIGANIGENTTLFAELGASVVAVEPVEACAAAIPRDERIQVLRRAVGAQHGSLELLVCSKAMDISTASPEWIERLGAAGLVRGPWDRSETVPMCTLDELIAEFGTPAFVKIDVEGFELEVLRGLSSSLAAVSLETHAALADKAIACVRRLVELGFSEFAVSAGHSAVLSAWLDASGAEQAVSELEWGDLYAR
jgi:FkbM family methyltransferase